MNFGSKIKNLSILQPLRRLVRLYRVWPQVKRAKLAIQAMSTGQSGSGVCYLTKEFPAGPKAQADIVVGGAVKLTYLAERFAHNPIQPELLYIVSSVEHPAVRTIVDRAKTLGIPVILNQNGVYYNAWFGPGWAERNESLAYVHARADYIIYQSQFCERSARRFLGYSPAKTEVLYNPIDLNRFTPEPKTSSAGRLTLLVMASADWRRYRVEIAILTLAHLVSAGLDAELFVPGYDFDRDRLTIQALLRISAHHGINADRIRFAPAFSRQAAPSVFQQANILLHPVYNDPSPNVVGEAMACGLPVIYSQSGGVTELVGDEAGVGVPAQENWETLMPPSPEHLAQGCKKIWNDLETYSKQARLRAEKLLAVDRYTARHSEIFAEVSSFKQTMPAAND